MRVFDDFVVGSILYVVVGELLGRGVFFVFFGWFFFFQWWFLMMMIIL